MGETIIGREVRIWIGDEIDFPDELWTEVGPVVWMGLDLAGDSPDMHCELEVGAPPLYAKPFAPL